MLQVIIVSGVDGRMEKFRGFSDPATGIHPFLPSWSNDSKSPNIKKITNALIAIATWPVRLFLILISLTLLPFKLLRPYGCRLLLAAVGVWKIQFKNWKYAIEIKKSKDAVVFCNLTSFAEILMLEYTISPIFAIVHSNGTLSILKFMDMLLFTIRHEVIMQLI